VGTTVYSCCGLLYPFVGGIENTGTIYQLHDIASATSPDGAATLLRGLYFSTITFTTSGDATVAPLHAGLWLLVGIESFLDAALMALLVAVLARLMIITNHSRRDL